MSELTGLNRYTELFIFYSAWALIVSAVLYVALVFYLGVRGLDINSMLYLAVIPTAILRIILFLYPVAILRLAVTLKSYQFLKKPVHYVALPICALIWISLFL